MCGEGSARGNETETVRELLDQQIIIYHYARRKETGAEQEDEDIEMEDND